MNRIVYILFLLGINIFRFIPFWMLYAMAYFVYLIIFYLVGYRRNVVEDNLSKCFTDKDVHEIKLMSKQFYKHNLSAIFVEGLKGFTMSTRSFSIRYQVMNPEILNEYFEKGQDVIALASHMTNWEWGIQAVGNQIRHQAAALYKPLTNEFIEEYTQKLRAQAGMKMVPITHTRAYFESKKEKPVLYIMAADQFPGGTFSKAIWVNFLGRDTACLHGPENYARFNNLPLVFFDVVRIRRGYYQLTIKKVEDSPMETEKGEITAKYMGLLEEAVKKNPTDWLWSHKRWKVERKTVE